MHVYLYVRERVCNCQWWPKEGTRSSGLEEQAIVSLYLVLRSELLTIALTPKYAYNN